MSVNLEKIKRRLDGFTNKNESENVQLQETRIKLQSPGTHTLRLVPYVQDPEYPFLELKIYYEFTKNGKRQQILSPISYGEKDPIYERAMTLRNTGVKEDWQLSKSIQPRMRVFVLAILRGQEQKGPRWWDFGTSVYQEILKIMKDPDYGDIFDPYQGTDIIVQRISKEQANNLYGDTKIRPKRASSPLSTNERQIDDWLKNQPDIYKSFKKYDYDELEQIWDEYVSKQSETDTKTEEVHEQNASTETEVLNVMDRFKKQMERKK